MATPAGAIDDRKQVQAVARAYFKAVYLNDRSQAVPVVLSPEGLSDFFGPKTLSKSEKAEAALEVREMRFRPLRAYEGLMASPKPPVFPIGAHLRFMTSVRGTPTVVSLQKTAEGWKVDLRWWREMMAMMRGREPAEHTPESVIKTYLFALMKRDEATLRKLLPKGSDTARLYPERYRPPFEDQYYYLNAEMPVVELGPSDLILIDGEYATPKNSGAGNRIFLGLYGSIEVVFELTTEDGKLKVEPALHLRDIEL
ncbi:MAG: hypothetical protein HY650_03195 [Acidobacteria bacterium]|nr:hypothetical protein [Acidobacteriota bacterium]